MDEIKNSVLKHTDEIMDLVKTMYEHPEIGNEEFETMKLLSSYLKKEGFEVEEGYVVPTGFIGKADSGKPGPTIAYLCEYDALPEVGHGCGHNLIAGISISAGIALKGMLEKTGGRVWVIGTPAEENFGGKVSMSEAGVFDQVDAAMMIHPGNRSGLGDRTNAINPLKFEFFGKNAHGCQPQEGKSALDAAVLCFVNINFMRQFVKAGSFIHGIFRDGGQAANVIPAYACLEYYFRGHTMAYVKEMCEMAENCVKGACEATGTSYKVSVYECPYEDFMPNYGLINMLEEKYAEIGVEGVEAFNETPGGSSDIGSVSYRCPALHGRIRICPDEVVGHSKEMAAATISPEGRNAMMQASEAIAMVGYDLMTQPEKLKAVKEEFKKSVSI